VTFKDVLNAKSIKQTKTQEKKAKKEYPSKKSIEEAISGRLQLKSLTMSCERGAILQKS